MLGSCWKVAGRAVLCLCKTRADMAYGMRCVRKRRIGCERVVLIRRIDGADTAYGIRCAGIRRMGAEGVSSLAETLR
eukprot:1768421-Rhodomonas_salina.1